MSTEPAPGPLGIIVNPFAGRDVRRTTGQASIATNEAKCGEVKRLVIGAAAAGARRILLLPDLFRISQMAAVAVEGLGLDVDIELLELATECRPSDTARAALAMREAGCAALVVLGGDGTSRVVAGAWRDAPLLPLSLGTNNVFPLRCEATTAGAAAGLVAAGRVALADVSRPVKVVRVEGAGARQEVALVDAALLVDDKVGNLRPFDADRIHTVVLARAEADAVGMSPIGGLLHPCGTDDDFGVVVQCTPNGGGGRPLLAPISPGLYRTVGIRESRRLALGEAVEIRGPGVLAFDGDREWMLADGEGVRLRVERDGPRVLDVDRALRIAAERGLYLDRPHWHDPREGGFDCC